MPKSREEDFPDLAEETSAGGPESAFSAADTLSPALAWARERYQFDPASPHEPQGGVRELQQWLAGEDATLVADGRLGPQTLAVLEGAYRRLRAAEEKAQQSETVKAPDSDATSARPVALSDSAISDIEQDRLGFRPYVEAVAEFILAEQTRPPLAIAINAPWGQGKTSFMNMLDKQLRRAAQGTTTRVATTWFNPWKYSEPEQVWAAFVANVTRCLRANLTREQSWRFRWGRFRGKWRRHADFAFVLRLLVALSFLILILGIVSTMQLAPFDDWAAGDKGVVSAFYKAVSAALKTTWWSVLIGPFALLALLYGYVTFTKNLGLNLLEYVEKTDFRDKIGTLSQFEHEMRRLADAVPEDLKVIVFIDDLDRCKGKVLGEIIEALQLADVSRSCIFVMAMDLKIVAAAIEKERGELALSVDSAASQMEHGRGYKFLEKIIQARLSLPAHRMAQMSSLVEAAMAPDGTAAGPPATERHGPATGLGDRLRQGIGLSPRSERRTPSDSASLIDRARHYGSRHFNNPRRLKRFINSLRLQTYLTAAMGSDGAQNERLARFLVLAEKWPAIVDHIVTHSLRSDFWKHESDPQNTGIDIAAEIRRLPKDELDKLAELLLGQNGDDPLEAEVFIDLANGCGFAYYRGIDAKSL